MNLPYRITKSGARIAEVHDEVFSVGDKVKIRGSNEGPYTIVKLEYVKTELVPFAGHTQHIFIDPKEDTKVHNKAYSGAWFTKY